VWTRDDRMCRGRRSNRRTRRGRGSSRRRGGNRRASHHWPGRRLCSNRRSRRRRRSHDLRRLARLRHDNAARRRRFRLGRSDRRGCRRGRGRRSARYGRRRGCRLGRRWRRSRSICLFLALLNSLQDIAGLGHPRPVDLRRPTLVLGCRRAAIPAASALKMDAHALRLVSLERARMRLGVRHSYFAQYVQNRLALDFELSC
jgi:hypothetical protein